MCNHFWLPKRGHLFRYVVCAHCETRRRVRFRYFTKAPATIGDALGEAIDRGVVKSDEVTWRGGPLR